MNNKDLCALVINSLSEVHGEVANYSTVSFSRFLKLLLNHLTYVYKDYRIHPRDVALLEGTNRDVAFLDKLVDRYLANRVREGVALLYPAPEPVRVLMRLMEEHVNQPASTSFPLSDLPTIDLCVRQIILILYKPKKKWWQRF